MFATNFLQNWKKCFCKIEKVCLWQVGEPIGHLLPTNLSATMQMTNVQYAAHSLIASKAFATHFLFSATRVPHRHNRSQRATSTKAKWVHKSIFPVSDSTKFPVTFESKHQSHNQHQPKSKTTVTIPSGHDNRQKQNHNIVRRQTRNN